MADAPAHLLPEIVAGKRRQGRVAALYRSAPDHFVTHRVEVLALGFDGIAEDVHGGPTRRSGSREPWYPRGTEIRNERQLSIVAPDELALVASRMDLAEIRPEWIGANLLLEGLPALSMLPAGTLLFFAGGATLKVDAQNGPCRIAGRSIADHAGLPEPTEAALTFPKAAKRLRGLVAWVEKPGLIREGESLTAKIPEQWIYPG